VKKLIIAIRNNIIKTVLSDRKHFLVYIYYVFKVLVLAFI